MDHYLFYIQTETFQCCKMFDIVILMIFKFSHKTNFKSHGCLILIVPYMHIVWPPEHKLDVLSEAISSQYSYQGSFFKFHFKQLI